MAPYWVLYRHRMAIVSKRLLLVLNHKQTLVFFVKSQAESERKLETYQEVTDLMILKNRAQDKANLISDSDSKVLRSLIKINNSWRENMATPSHFQSCRTLYLVESQRFATSAVPTRNKMQVKAVRWRYQHYAHFQENSRQPVCRSYLPTRNLTCILVSHAYV